MPNEANEEGNLPREIVYSLAGQRRRFLLFLRRRLADPSRAEDLLQAAFARALEHASDLENPDRAVAWFYRILRNALVDDSRRQVTRDREIALEDPDLIPANEPRRLRTCACAAKQLHSLKPEYADVLRAVTLGEAAICDYAGQSGITPAHASVRLHRARTALRKKVEAVCRSCAERGCFDCSCP